MTVRTVALLPALLGLDVCRAATNSFSFTYANRAALLADGWDFVARTAGGAPRDTETTTGAVVSYDQTAHPGMLRIPVEVGNMWESANNTRNSLFRNLSSNWSSVRLELTFTPTQNVQQVHLSLYQNDDNYVQAGVAFNGGEKVALDREFGGSPSTVAFSSVSATNMHLRLDRELNYGVITVLYSLDGTNWVSLGQVNQELVSPRLGIWAGGSLGGVPYADLRRLEVITSDTPVSTTLVLPSQTVAFNSVAGQVCTNVLKVPMVRRGPVGLHWTMMNTVPWLSASSTNGNTTGSFDLSANTAGLPAGIYQTVLQFVVPGAANNPAHLSVVLIVNPDSRARVSTWKAAKKAALSVWVDDSDASMFDTLKANAFSGTYALWNLSPIPSYFSNYYQSGMELGSHTVNHPCFPVNDPTMRFEIETNIANIIAATPQPQAKLISFAWPCGVTSIQQGAIASDYYLIARGYNINQLEDRTPKDFMNVKSFNSHEHSPFPPADLKTIVDDAMAQGKWANLVFHAFSNDDGAVAYSVGKDIWVATGGAVTKYILQRDRTVITNYTETTTAISFDCYRLPLNASVVRSFESAIDANDSLTVELDITTISSVGGLTVEGVGTPYTVRDVGAKRILFFDTIVTTNVLAQSVALVISNGNPVAVSQMVALPEDGATNLVLIGTGLPGQALTHAISSQPTHGALSGSPPNVTYTPTSNFFGLDSFKFTVTGTNSSLVATGTVTLAIAPVNDAPMVANPISNQAATYGTPFNFTFAANTFTDVDGDTLSHTATGMPPGITFAGVSRTFAGTPSQLGNFVVQVIAHDDKIPDLTATNVFTISIADVPRLRNIFEAAQGSFVLEWRVHPGRSYRFQYKTDLPALAWTTLGEDQTAASSSLAITNIAGTNLHRFYRVLDLTVP